MSGTTPVHRLGDLCMWTELRVETRPVEGTTPSFRFNEEGQGFSIGRVRDVVVSLSSVRGSHEVVVPGQEGRG